MVLFFFHGRKDEGLVREMETKRKSTAVMALCRGRKDEGLVREMETIRTASA